MLKTKQPNYKFYKLGALLLSALTKGMGKREPYTITVCSNHEQPVPMIWTFAFPGSEFWCPECGSNRGAFDADKIDATPELYKLKKQLIKSTEKYLDARSALTCDEIKYRGKWIKPKDLPPKVLQKYRDICEEFENNRKDKDENIS